MTAIRLAALVALSCLALPAWSAPPRNDGAWNASCGAAQCSASVRTQVNARDAAYGAQLRVSRVAGGDHELVLISPHAQPASGSAIEVRVDGQAVTRLAAGSDYRPVRSSGTLMIDRAAAQRLYAPMRAGKRIAFAFRTVREQDVTLDLALNGFSAAARKIGLTIPAARDDAAMASGDRATSPKNIKRSAPPKNPDRAAPSQSAERAVPPAASADAASPPLPPGRGGPPVLEGPTLPSLEEEDVAAPLPVPPVDEPQAPRPQARPRMGEVVLATLRSRGPDDWTRFLPELRAAIDACLERTPGSDLHVTKAWPMTGGLAGVRTRNATVGWFDCTAAQAGSRVERFVAVSKEVGRAPGEDLVVFTRVDGQPLEGKCYRTERVIDDYKETVGWLSRNLCHPDAAPVGRR